MNGGPRGPRAWGAIGWSLGSQLPVTQTEQPHGGTGDTDLLPEWRESAFRVSDNRCRYSQMIAADSLEAIIS